MSDSIAQPSSTLFKLSPEHGILEFKLPSSGSPSVTNKQTVTLTNTTSSTSIAFKVKTTNPKQYSVKPNSGRLAPGASISIAIVFGSGQATVGSGEGDVQGWIDSLMKKKDKFLFQVLAIPSGSGSDDDSGVNDLWTNAELLRKTNGGDSIIFEQKLRSVFVLADSNYHSSSGSVADRDQGSVSGRDRPLSTAFSDMSTVTALPPSEPATVVLSEPRKSSPPLQQFQDTLSRPSTNTTTTATASSPTPNANQDIGATSPLSGRQSSAPSAHPSPTTVTATSPSRELQDAREKIKSLQAAIEGYKLEIERINALRQRRNEAAPTGTVGTGSGPGSPTRTSLKPQQDNMYPIHLVMIIAVLSFFFGVWFF